MYKVFILVAIVIMPLFQHLSNSNTINVAGKPTLRCTFKNSLPPKPFESKKNNIVDTAALKQSDWYAAIVKNIEASEYEIKKDNKRNLFAAPNRQQLLSASFNYNSFTLQPRDEKKQWTLNLQLKGIYADNNLFAVPNKNDLPVTSANKIVFSNNDFSTEYINSEEGIRENFIIKKEPVGKPKTISLKLEANKNWFVNKVHNKEIHFAKATRSGYDKKIIYNSLKVWDANNKELEAKFVVNEKRTALEIEVTTENAVYPITVDPLSTTPSTTINGINAGGQFGFNVASVGDVNGDGYSDVIVGAYAANAIKGAAYVYLGSSTGLAVSPATTLNGISAGDAFGVSIAGAGDVNGDGYSDVAIGASGVSSNKGAAYIYLGSNTGLPASPATTLNGISAGDYFGVSIAGTGDINGDGYSDVVVGAYAANANKGAAYIYLGSNTGLAVLPATTLNGISTADHFGYSVSGAGDVNGDGYNDVVVGAYGVSSAKGAAYVYLGGIAGLATSPVTTLADINNITTDYFGFNVACAGDINGDGYSDVIVGAYGVSSAKGAAYVYLGNNTGIASSPATTLTDINNTGNDLFGENVASVGDINGDGYSDVIVSAPGVSSAKGAAYVYLGSNTGLVTSPTTTLLDINNINNDMFGSGAVSAGDINGDGYSDIIVGARGVSSNTGAIYTYHGSADGLSASQVRIVSPVSQSVAGVGNSVASAGDVNGDGYSDVIIGAPLFDDGVSVDEGRAWVYYGSATGLSATPDVVLDDANQAGANFGYSVASAGDVNGDGYSDVIVGAYLYTGANTNEGRAWVHYGSASGLSVAANRILNDANQAGAGFGNSVASAGDVNGDGYSDVIVGARFYDGSFGADEGRAYVYYGSATGLAATPSSTPDDANQAGANFGVYVACAGDVNGDGFSDIIIGAHLYDGSFGADEGRAYVYYGSSTGLSASPNRTLADAGQAGAGFGVRVASAGDVNGDGLGDVIVAGIFYGGGKGRVWIYYGHAVTGLSATPDVILDNSSGSSTDYMGYSIAAAGDVNGDGYGDVIVGIPQHSVTYSQDGETLVYYGSASGLSSTPNLILHDATEDHEFFGLSSAGAGDINGDGYSDVIVGADHGSYASTAGGKVYVHNGNDSITNKRNNLRLYNTDLTTPINSANFVLGNFGVGLFAKSFIGRDKGKLIWETRLNYNPFSGTPITNSTFSTAQQGTYTDLGLSGIELKNIVAKINGAGFFTKLRARVKYNLATAITGQVYGPWRYVSPIIDGNLLGALPIELISFNAVWLQKGITAQLSFTTDKELGTCCFDIEKSTDGFSFTTIATIAAKNSSGLQSYHFVDNNAINKSQFYRLKIKGSNGQVQYSNIQALQNNIATEILVFPNPVTDVLQLQLNNNYDKINVQVVNTAGQIVKQWNDLAVFNQTIGISVSNLPSGYYWLKLQTGTQRQVLQFVKN